MSWQEQEERYACKHGTAGGSAYCMMCRRDDDERHSRLQRDLELLAQLRAHPNAQDVADWLERATDIWSRHGAYHGSYEVAIRLVGLLRGGTND